MRCLYFWPLLLFTTTFSFAQPTGTEWIRAGQPYYKIPVAKAATYALKPDHFRRMGIDPATVDPRTVQLVHRGREQAVRVSGETDGRFDPGDSLLFRGQANDGVPDSALYRPASAQPHPFYSLFSDTTYYFLTWRTGVPGLREPVKQPESGKPISRTVVQVFTTDYPAGAIYPLGASTANGSVLSQYDEGEGWTGPVVSAGQPFSLVVPLTGAVWTDSSSVRVEVWVAGRNAWPHRVMWWVNGQRVAESEFQNYTTGRFSVLLRSTEIGKPDALTVVLDPQNVGEQVSLSAVWVLYDGLAEREIILPAPDLQPVRFRALEGRKSNYLIVTHPLLRQPVGTVADPVTTYASYRASLAGGSYDTLTVNSDELFDLFTYGERSPLAIRRFAAYMLRQNGSRYTQAPHLFLIGQSRDPQGVRKNPNAPLLDLVPNGGWPGSDALLVEGLNGAARDTPALAVGRLNTARPQTVLDYLSKVREQEENSRPQLWRKTLLHLSGGRSAEELSRFREFVQEFAQVAEQPPLGAGVVLRGKQTTELVEAVPVADLINKGVGLITVFGHSGLDVTDVDLGFATDDRRGYQNRGRYPFLLVNGCAAGNIFFGRPTFGTDWVTAPNRGAIGFLAHTYNGFPNEMRVFTDAFYNTLNDPHWQAETVGRVHGETIRRYLATNQTGIDTANAQQFLLQGDPAIRLFPFDKPDYAFGESNQLTTSTDSLSVRVVFTNAGRAEPGIVPLRIRQYTPEGQLLSEQTRSLPRPLFSDTLTLKLPTHSRPASGQVIELKLNPAEQLPEYDFANNTLILGDTSSTELPFPPDHVPPLLEVAFDGQRIENEAIVAPSPLISLRIRDDNPRLFRRDTTGLLLYLLRPAQAQTGQFERLNWRNATTTSEENGRSFRVDYRPTNPLPDGRYELEAYASDLSGNRAAPYRIGFQVMTEPRVLTAGVGPNPFGGLGGNVPTRFYLTLTGSEPPERVQLTVTNLGGQVVWQTTQPGRIGLHEWFWSGNDEYENALPAGVYLYHFELVGLGASAFSASKGVHLTGRVLLIR